MSKVFKLWDNKNELAESYKYVVVYIHQKKGEGEVDNQVMMSIGKAAEEMQYAKEDIFWHGIPYL